MAGIDINVLLNDRAGQVGVSPSMSRAKNKLSAKGSSELKRNLKARDDMIAGMSAFQLSGSALKGFVMAQPAARAITTAIHAVDKPVNFGINLYSAYTGENMIADNMKAQYRTATRLKTNLIGPAIQNFLYRRPTVQRQNYMLDYGREIYFRNVENEKNKFN